MLYENSMSFMKRSWKEHEMIEKYIMSAPGFESGSDTAYGFKIKRVATTLNAAGRLPTGWSCEWLMLEKTFFWIFIKNLKFNLIKFEIWEKNE